MTYIFNFLTYTEDGLTEFFPDLQTLISEYAVCNKLFNILNSKAAYNPRPSVLIELINELRVLHERGHPQAESVLDYQIIIDAELLLSEDQAYDFEHLRLQIGKVNLLEYLPALAGLPHDLSERLEPLLGLISLLLLLLLLLSSWILLILDARGFFLI